MTPSRGHVLFALGGTLIVCATLAYVASRGQPGQSGPWENVTARDVARPSHQAGVFVRTESRALPDIDDGTRALDTAGTASAVRGRVLDEDGHPVAGALVTLESEPKGEAWRGATTTTDADGEYWFEKQELGTVEIAVRLDSESAWCAPPPERVTLAEREDKTGVDFRLVRGLSIVGFVDGDNLAPIEDAYVSAEMLVAADSTETLARKVAHTDASGFFEIKSIKPGAKVTKLAAHASGFRTSTRQPLGPFDQVQQFTLERLGEVVVLARDAVCSTPLARFRYRLDPTAPAPVEHPLLQEWTEPTILERRGEAHLGGIPPGLWQVSVEELTEVGNTTGRCAEVCCEIKGGTNTVQVCVGMTMPVHGVVLDATGRAARGAEVSIYRRRFRRSRLVDDPATTLITDSGGVFLADSLEQGLYEISVQSVDFGTTQLLLQVPPETCGQGRPAEMVLHLMPQP